MGTELIIFYFISAFIIGAALLAVTTKMIFRSAIWLLCSLIGIAGLYFLLEVNFIAALQIVVYVGGIVVLIIFSIFLTQKSGDKMPSPPVLRQLFGLLAIVFGVSLIMYMLYQFPIAKVSNAAFDLKVSNIGIQMLDTTQYGFVLPFEVVSILLLAAMIGCIVIAMKQSPNNQSIVENQN